jgi:putative polyhydroxyalkanoate system protein
MLDCPAMQKMEVDIPHRLSRDEARSRLDRITERLARDYSAACNWDGQGRLVVTRKGLEASLDIVEDKVHVDLQFGMFMRPFAGTIRAGIVKQLSELLA